AEAPVDVELLDLEFPHVARGRHRMLDLELGVELGALVERVTEPEHAAREVRLAAPPIPRRIGEIHLAIAPEPRTLPCVRPREPGDPDCAQAQQRCDGVAQRYVT